MGNKAVGPMHTEPTSFVVPESQRVPLCDLPFDALRLIFNNMPSGFFPSLLDFRTICKTANGVVLKQNIFHVRNKLSVVQHLTRYHSVFGCSFPPEKSCLTILIFFVVKYGEPRGKRLFYEEISQVICTTMIQLKQQNLG